MHGVGVFDYATLPGVIRTQVYMCPTAQCNPEKMAKGDCLTYIQAIAIQIGNKQRLLRHSVIFRNNGLEVDHVDRRNEQNMTLGAEVAVTASGLGAATEHPARVDHKSVAKCHVLSSKGQLVPKTMEMRALDGGVWKECTRNEWTLTTPALTIDVGVIGPFEEGFLRERVSNRTFNLNVRNVNNRDTMDGIINGDKACPHSRPRSPTRPRPSPTPSPDLACAERPLQARP